MIKLRKMIKITKITKIKKTDQYDQIWSFDQIWSKLRKMIKSYTTTLPTSLVTAKNVLVW